MILVEQCGFTIEYIMRPKGADRIDPDQTAPSETVCSFVSSLHDHGLYCLLELICLKTLDHYGSSNEYM